MVRSRFKRPWEPPAWLAITLFAWGLSWYTLVEAPHVAAWAYSIRQGSFTLATSLACFLSFWLPTLLMNTITGGRRERS